MTKRTNTSGIKSQRCASEPRVWPFLVAAAACLLPTLSQAQAGNYSAPIVITKGGTYTGNYQSLASGVPCVLVNTTERVVLQGCKFSGAGNLVQSGSGANLVVRNCVGAGLAPSVDNQAPGHFVDAYQSQSLVIEHNYFAGTSGIVVNRWSGSSTPQQTLTVRYNQARNIDGRWRNAGGSTRSSFLLLNTVARLAGADISYNEVVNTPNQSLVEDNINLYNSSGTAESPLRVHDNFVRGAYPFPATDARFTGTGMTTDGDANTFADAAGYIEADHNQFVATCNAAMNIAAGHDVYYHDNRLVTSALLPDGTRLAATYAATAVFNYYNQVSGVFGNNRVQNNTIGYVKWGSNAPYTNRQDLSPGACASCTGTVNLPNPVTTSTEDNEATLWQQKVQQAGVTLGPVNGAAPAPVAPAPVAPTPIAPVASGANLVANPGFEADGAAVGAPTGWQTIAGAGTEANADYSETYPGAHAGVYHATHYRPDDYEVYTYQVINNVPSGTYTLRAWVKSSGGQNQALLVAKNYGGGQLAAPIGATGSDWALVEVKNVAVSNGKCEIGFYSKAKAGQFLYTDDVELTAQSPAQPVVPTGANPIANASFEADGAAVGAPLAWRTITGQVTNDNADYSETYGGAHSGTYHATHYRPENYEVYTYQVVNKLPDGTYTLSAWVKSSGGQAQALLLAKNYGGPDATAPVPATPDGQWVRVSVPNIVVNDGQCEVGLYSKAQGGQWLHFDDVQLVLQSSAQANKATQTASIATASPALYPNPANDQVTVAASFTQATPVTLVVSNLQGTPVARSGQQAQTGNNKFTLRTADLPNGIYVLQIQSNQPTLVQRLEVKH